MDEARTRVRRHLEEILTQLQRGPEGGLTEHAEGVLDVLVELDVLSAEEAGEWRGRLRRALDDDLAVDADFRQQASDYLGDALARARSDGGYDFARAQRYHNALAALQALGAFAPGQFPELARRASPLTGLPPVRPGPPPEPPPCYEARELIAVVPGPPERRNGLRIASVDFYADCTIVTWHLVMAVGDQPSRHDNRPQLQLTDDVGSRYRSAGAGSHSGESHQEQQVIFGQTIFAPAAPADAEWVEVRDGDDAFRVPTPTGAK